MTEPAFKTQSPVTADVATDQDGSALVAQLEMVSGQISDAKGAIGNTEGELCEGAMVDYHAGDHWVQGAVVAEVHRDDRVPYYPVRFATGQERRAECIEIIKASLGELSADRRVPDLGSPQYQPVDAGAGEGAEGVGAAALVSAARVPGAGGDVSAAAIAGVAGATARP